MVGREADGPMCAVLGRSRGLCGQSWAALGASVGCLGPLSGPMWAVLAAIGAYVGSLGKGIRSKSGPNPSGKAICQAGGPN